jgi:cell pole-organizing protein PopZ
VSNITEAMLAKAAQRITGINEVTRDAVREVVAEGVRRGYSIPQIANGVEAEGFRGVNALPQFDTARADLVARTETMLAYNESALRGYREFGVEYMEIIDGDVDDECKDRLDRYPDGIWPIDEALAEEDHPNGTLDWIPLSDKAAHRETDRFVELATKAIEALSVVQPAPTFNVTMPEQAPRDDSALVEIAAKMAELAARPQAPQTFVLGTDAVVSALQPQNVQVDAPDLSPLLAAVKDVGDRIEAMEHVPPIVNVKAPVVNVDSVRVTSLPDRVHRVSRDNSGKPTGSVETDA